MSKLEEQLWGDRFDAVRDPFEKKRLICEWKKEQLREHRLNRLDALLQLTYQQFGERMTIDDAQEFIEWCESHPRACNYYDIEPAKAVLLWMNTRDKTILEEVTERETSVQSVLPFPSERVVTVEVLK